MLKASLLSRWRHFFSPAKPAELKYRSVGSSFFFSSILRLISRPYQHRWRRTKVSNSISHISQLQQSAALHGEAIARSVGVTTMGGCNHELP